MISIDIDGCFVNMDEYHNNNGDGTIFEVGCGFNFLFFLVLVLLLVCCMLTMLYSISCEFGVVRFLSRVTEAKGFVQFVLLIWIHVVLDKYQNT